MLGTMRSATCFQLPAATRGFRPRPIFCVSKGSGPRAPPLSNAAHCEAFGSALALIDAHESEVQSCEPTQPKISNTLHTEGDFGQTNWSQHLDTEALQHFVQVRGIVETERSRQFLCQLMDF